MNTVWKSLALLLCCLGTACETPGPVQGRAPAPRPGNPLPDSTDILRVGEKIQVLLADLPTGIIGADLTISEDGKITLHLDQTFQAAGKTRSKLETEIRARYVPNFYTKMTVTVKQEERFVYVGGFVKQPNRYPYTPGLTVLKSISAAGDFSEFGDKTKVTITRSGDLKETMDCKAAIENPSLDRPLFPGDRIYVPRRFF
ncbi:MAG: polysaccharide export protein [Verrucomicrobia bacterium]|nr:polysaccharide export protein [Verrucomicrobiota bacterium]